MDELPNGAIVSRFPHGFDIMVEKLWTLGLQEGVEQRRQADDEDGGEEAIAVRLEQGRNALLVVLLTVGASSVLAVMLDGDAGAVYINKWAPLLMLGLLALLASTQAIRRCSLRFAFRGRFQRFALRLQVALLGGRHNVMEGWRSRISGLDLRTINGQSRAAGSESADPFRSSYTGDASEAQTAAAPEPAHTPRTALFSVEFWLIFCVMATVCGSNSATMVRQITHARARHIHTCSCRLLLLQAVCARVLLTVPSLSPLLRMLSLQSSTIVTPAAMS